MSYTYKNRGWIDERQFRTAMENFAGETTRLSRLKAFNISAITSEIIASSWKYILAHNIYEADALQLVSYTHSNSDLLLSADNVLVKAAFKEGIKALNIEKQSDKVLASL